jgi:hypothetical protein
MAVTECWAWQKRADWGGHFWQWVAEDNLGSGESMNESQSCVFNKIAMLTLYQFEFIIYLQSF